MIKAVYVMVLILTPATHQKEMIYTKELEAKMAKLDFIPRELETYFKKHPPMHAYTSLKDCKVTAAQYTAAIRKTVREMISRTNNNNTDPFPGAAPAHTRALATKPDS